MYNIRVSSQRKAIGNYNNKRNDESVKSINSFFDAQNEAIYGRPMSKRYKGGALPKEIVEILKRPREKEMSPLELLVIALQIQQEINRYTDPITGEGFGKKTFNSNSSSNSNSGLIPSLSSSSQNLDTRELDKNTRWNTRGNSLQPLNTRTLIKLDDNTKTPHSTYNGRKLLSMEEDNSPSPRSGKPPIKLDDNEQVLKENNVDIININAEGLLHLHDPKILYLIVKNVKPEIEINEQNPELNKYKDLAIQIFADADALNLSYQKKVMLGMLCVSNSKKNLALPERDLIQKYSQKYFGDVNITELINNINDKRNDKSGGLSLTVIFGSATIANIFNSLEILYKNFFLQYRYRHHKVLSTNPEDRRAVINLGKTRPHILLQTGVANILGFTSGIVYPYIANALNKKSSDLTDVEVNDLINKFMKNSVESFPTIDRNNIMFCINSILKDVKGIIKTFNFPLSYKNDIWEIIHSSCSAGESSKEITNKVVELKVKQLMRKNNMPTADYRLKEQVSKVYLLSGEDAVAKLKSYNDLDSMISVRRRKEFLPKIVQLKAEQPNSIDIIEAFAQNKISFDVMMKQIIDRIYSESNTLHFQKQRNKRYIENPVEEFFDIESIDFISLIKDLGGVLIDFVNAYAVDQKTKDNNSAFASLKTEATTLDDYNIHIRNLQHLNSLDFNADGSYFKQEYKDAAQYLNQHMTTQQKKENPEIYKLINRINDVSKVLDGLPSNVNLQIKEDRENKLDVLANMLVDSVINLVANPRFRRDLGSNYDNQLTEEDLDRIMNKIDSYKESTVDTKLRIRRGANVNSYGSSKLPDNVEANIGKWFKDDVVGEVIEEISERVVEKIKNFKFRKRVTCFGKTKSLITFSKQELMKSLRTAPRTLWNSALSVGKAVGVGLVLESLVGLVVTTKYDNELANIKNKFNAFIEYLAKNIGEDLEIYARSKGYTSIKSMVKTISEMESEEEKNILRDDLLLVIRQSYNNHIVIQMIKDIKQEGDAHEEKIGLSILSSMFSLVSLSGGPLGAVAGIAGSIPASSFINPELTLTNECFAGNQASQRFGYASSLAFVGSFLEVVDNILNAENFVSHQYDTSDSQCNQAMQNPQKQIMEEFDNMKYAGLHAKFKEVNQYSLYQFQNHINNIQDVAELHEIVNSEVQDNYGGYLMSPEEQRITTIMDNEFASYLNDNQNYKDLTKNVQIKERRRDQLKINVLISRYVNPSFNKYIHDLYPQLYTVLSPEVSPEVSARCVQNTGRYTEPSCIRIGDRKLEQIVKQGCNNVEELKKLEEDLSKLYNDRNKLFKQLSSNFQASKTYKKYQTDIASARELNDNSKYIDFQNKFNAWKNSASRTLKNKANFETKDNIKNTFKILYESYEALTLYADNIKNKGDRETIQEVSNIQFASYMQEILIATQIFNDEQDKNNPGYQYQSPIREYLKDRNLLIEDESATFNSFISSSNSNGKSVNNQINEANKLFLKGVVDNSRWPYGLIYNFLMETHGYFRIPYGKTANTYLKNAAEANNYKIMNFEKNENRLILGATIDRASQLMNMIITPEKLKEEFKNRPRLNDKKFDAYLMAQISSLANKEKKVTVSKDTGVVNHVGVNIGKWLYHQNNFFYGSIPILKPYNHLGNVLGSTTKIVDEKSNEAILVQKYLEKSSNQFPTLVDNKTLHKYPELFKSYLEVYKTITYANKDSDNFATIFGDAFMKQQISTNGKKNTYTMGSLDILDYREFKLSLNYMAFWNSFYHSINKGNLELFSREMQVLGMPVFNADNTINFNAVNSLVTQLSENEIKSMPKLKSYDGSIEIPAGLFSIEKIRAYAKELMPKIESPNDYKILIINQCVNAISAGNVVKSSQCIPILQNMQKQSIPDNIKLFDQLGMLITQANNVIKTQQLTYIAPPDINFTNEYIQLLISQFNQDGSLDGNKLEILSKLILINNYLLSLNAPSKDIHNLINSLKNNDIETAKLLIILGYPHIAKYDATTDIITNIDYSALQILKKSVIYFSDFDTITEYKNKLSVYNSLGFYSANAKLNEHINNVYEAINDSKSSNNPKIKNAFLMISTEIKKEFLNNNPDIEVINDLQLLMIQLHQYILQTQGSKALEFVNVKLLEKILVENEKPNYLSFAKAMLPESSHVGLNTLQKYTDANIFIAIVKKLVSQDTLQNFKDWIKTKNLPLNIAEIALRVFHSTSDNILLDLNVYSKKEKQDNLFAQSLNSETLPNTDKQSYILKNVQESSSALKIFNLSTLAIFLDDGVITYKDIENCKDNLDIATCNVVVAKIKTLIKSYQLDGNSDSNTQPYVLQNDVDAAYNNAIAQLSRNVINNDDIAITLTNNFKQITPRGRQYTVTLDKRSTIQSLETALKIIKEYNNFLYFEYNTFSSVHVDSPMLNAKFKEFSNNLRSILDGFFRNPESASLNNDKVNKLYSEFKSIINNFKKQYDKINPLSLGLKITSLENYATIKVEPISTIPYEYYLSILEPSPVTPVMRRVKRNDETIPMAIDEDLFIDVNNHILRYKDTYVTVIDGVGKNHVIQTNQGSIHLLLAKINNIANIKTIYISTPLEIVNAIEVSNARALMPSSVEAIIKSDNALRSIALYHTLYNTDTIETNHIVGIAKITPEELKSFNSRYNTNFDLAKSYVTQAYEDMNTFINQLITKYNIGKESNKVITKDSFISYILSDRINVGDKKHYNFLLSVIKASNRDKNYLLSKIPYDSTISSTETTGRADIDLVFGEFNLHIPDYKKIIFYNKDEINVLVGLFGLNSDLAENKYFVDSLANKNRAKPINGLKDLSNMYPVDISTDVIKVHARLFLDMANLLSENPDLDGIKDICNNLFKTYDSTNSMSDEDLTKFDEALDSVWKQVEDPMIFSAITSSLVMSTLNKASTAAQDITNMEKISQLDLSTLPNNLNWFLDPQVIDMAKSISLRFRLSEAIKEQSDEIKMGLICGNNKYNTIYDAALFMSNIDQDLNIARYVASTSEYQSAEQLPREVIRVKIGVEDTKKPTIEESMLISTFKDHPNKFGGVRVLFPENIDLTKRLKAVYYDGNTDSNTAERQIKDAIGGMDKNNNQISFLIETHGSPGTNKLADDSGNLLPMIFLDDDNINREEKGINFIYLIDQVVKQRIANEQKKPFDIRFNLHACQGALCSREYKSHTGLSDSLPVTTISDSALSNMQLRINQYWIKNKAKLEQAGISNIVLTGFYGEVYVNEAGMSSQTTDVPGGTYLRLSTNLKYTQSDNLKWTASRHNIHSLSTTPRDYLVGKSLILNARGSTRNVVTNQNVQMCFK
ncbi:MAG: hypothetical protein LW807_05355 [Proteobacteria bacterium]|nr:hypothetical protein [Pseudomonadota bacterium]